MPALYTYFPPFPPHTALCGGCCYHHPHFLGEETEAQSRRVSALISGFHLGPDRLRCAQGSSTLPGRAGEGSGPKVTSMPHKLEGQSMGRTVTRGYSGPRVPPKSGKAP